MAARNARSYRLWAPLYDASFGLVTAAARRAAVSRISGRGGRTLDLGAGTGLSLVAYSDNVAAVGVDLSAAMLRVARIRLASAGRRNVLGLARMDAGGLAFAEATFDGAAALFVMAALPDPEAVMGELARVVRPGGELVIVNHFSHGGGWRAWAEARAAAIARRIGAASRTPIGRFLEQPGWSLTTSRRLPPFGLFTMLCLRREAEPVPDSEGEAETGEAAAGQEAPAAAAQEGAAGSAAEPPEDGGAPA